MPAHVKKLTTREVAARLGAGESSIRMWCKQGRFPNAEAVETLRGPVWLIPESDLAGFEKRERGRPPKALKKEKPYPKKSPKSSKASSH